MAIIIFVIFAHPPPPPTINVQFPNRISRLSEKVAKSWIFENFPFGQHESTTLGGFWLLLAALGSWRKFMKTIVLSTSGANARKSSNQASHHDGLT